MTLTIKTTLIAILLLSSLPLISLADTNVVSASSLIINASSTVPSGLINFDIPNSAGNFLQGYILFQRTLASSLNSIPWRMVVNQNPYVGSGVGGENYNNEVVAMGWNQGTTIGNRDQAGIGSNSDIWESKFNFNGHYQSERHMEMIDTSGVKHRYFSAALRHDGTLDDAGFWLDDFVLHDRPGAQKIFFDLANNQAYFGSSTTTPFILKFNANNSPVLTQLNAAGTAYLNLPYFNNSDQLVLSGQIVHNAPAPSIGTEGVAFNFSGAPGNGSTLLGIDAGAATNAVISGLAINGSTNWELINTIRNQSTSMYAAAENNVVTDGAQGWAFSRYGTADQSISWSLGKDEKGNFFIGGINPLAPQVLTIDNPTKNVGIGTSTPSAKLSVQGAINVSDKICIDSTCLTKAQLIKLIQLAGQ